MTPQAATLTPALLAKMDAYWRAANYLSVGQIYLCDNPLLKRPLTPADVKHMLLGHWGTTPGQNFIYTHLNRAIKRYDLNMIYVSGPGHGAQRQADRAQTVHRQVRPGPAGNPQLAVGRKQVISITSTLSRIVTSMNRSSISSWTGRLRRRNPPVQ